MSCFEVVGENDAYVIYYFIECGYHTSLIILEHKIGTKSQKSWGKSGGQRSDLVKHL